MQTALSYTSLGSSGHNVKFLANRGTLHGISAASRSACLYWWLSHLDMSPVCRASPGVSQPNLPTVQRLWCRYRDLSPVPPEQCRYFVDKYISNDVTGNFLQRARLWRRVLQLLRTECRRGRSARGPGSSEERRRRQGSGVLTQLCHNGSHFPIRCSSVFFGAILREKTRLIPRRLPT